MSGMPQLAAGFAFGVGLGAWWFGVRMFATGGQRGIAWRLVQSLFQFPNPRQQQANDGLRFRSLSDNQFVRDLQHHAGDCVKKRIVGQSAAPKSLPRVVAGYENRYTLPWNRLDLPKIEAAMKHVSANLSPRRTKLVVHEPDRVSCFFEVSPADERRWDVLGDLEARFAEEHIAESDTGWIEVEFCHYPPDDKSEFKGCTEFKFRSGRSGNGIYSGCAMEITERFGKFFGVQCERL